MQILLALFGRIGRSRCLQPTVKFLLYQRGVFQESDHLVPHDLIEQVLPDQAAVIANRAAQFAPAIRANTWANFLDMLMAAKCISESQHEPNDSALP